MKIKRFRKRIKTDEWNERRENRQGDKPKEEDRDWNKKNGEDEERGENENEFHEENYDT
ncbi:MAG: hypothetical protein KGD72_09875 [Candidatus Lokiarchaeota archaeon]|nr:hypothetical protein [Candidatus Lokiarchaeota archaeon]